MADSISIYYDYTCPYSYRAACWLRRLEKAGRELELEWKAFSLKEVNRPGGEPSVFDRQRAESVSVLALELAKPAQVAGPEVFERYHHRVFEEMHDDGRRLGVSDLLAIAQDARLDTGHFETERREGLWLRRVAEEHQEGAERWKVFGTPTLIFNDEAAIYLKFSEPPASPSDAAEVYDALLCLAKCHPELVEIKHPRGT